MIVESNNDDVISTENLIKFLNQNQAVDFLIFNLQDEEIVSALNFKNLKRKQTEILFQIKAYQRLIRIIPEKNQDVALSLIQAGIHSALQIAAMTRKDFMTKCAGLFSGNDNLADVIYKNALEKRSVILIQYMNLLQNGEPHMSSARFN